MPMLHPCVADAFSPCQQFRSPRLRRGFHAPTEPVRSRIAPADEHLSGVDAFHLPGPLRARFHEQEISMRSIFSHLKTVRPSLTLRAS